MNFDNETVLRRTLQANAAFSAISGFVAALAAGRLAAFLGLGGPTDLYPTAVSLLLFAVWVGWLSFREPLPRGQVAVVAALDWLWVLGSVPLVLGLAPQLTTGGRWMLGILALAVADFAVVQTLLLLRLSRDHRPAGV